MMLAGQLGLLLDGGFFRCCSARVRSPSTLFLQLLVSQCGPLDLLLKVLPNKPLPQGGLVELLSDIVASIHELVASQLELLSDVVASIRELVAGLLELLADVVASIRELAGLLMTVPVLVTKSSGHLILGSPSLRRGTARVALSFFPLAILATLASCS